MCWFVALDTDRVEVSGLRDGRFGAPVVVECGDVVYASVLEGLKVAVDDMVVR